MTLSDSVHLTTTYEAIQSADYIIISVGAQGLQQIVSDMADKGVKDKIIVLCMKGIEIETGRRLSQVASDTLDSSNHIAVWLGSGHVQEFYRGVPNCMVIFGRSLKNEFI